MPNLISLSVYTIQLACSINYKRSESYFGADNNYLNHNENKFQSSKSIYYLDTFPYTYKCTCLKAVEAAEEGEEVAKEE